ATRDPVVNLERYSGDRSWEPNLDVSQFHKYAVWRQWRLYITYEPWNRARLYDRVDHRVCCWELQCRARSHRRCRTARPDLRERWPSRLVATAAEDRLNAQRALDIGDVGDLDLIHVVGL